jgi:hypothetical protein
MKCDSQASFLACTFASLCLDCEPKAKVATPGKKYDALDVVHTFKTDSSKPCVLVVMKPSYV